MKIFSLLLLPLICVLLSSCQSHRRDIENAAVLVNQLNLMAAQEIAHEKNGDPPPKRFPTWQAFWHNRIFALQHSAQDARHGHVSTRQIADANVTFIIQKRAQLGLPPIQ